MVLLWWEWTALVVSPYLLIKRISEALHSTNARTGMYLVWPTSPSLPEQKSVHSLFTPKGVDGEEDCQSVVELWNKKHQGEETDWWLTSEVVTKTCDELVL